jgi:hypothetical protein
LIDFLIDVLLMPRPIWVGLGLGVLAATGAWFFLPESMDRASIGGLCIGVGFIGGLLYCFPVRKEK